MVNGTVDISDAVNNVRDAHQANAYQAVPFIGKEVSPYYIVQLNYVNFAILLCNIVVYYVIYLLILKRTLHRLNLRFNISAHKALIHTHRVWCVIVCVSTFRTVRR